MWNLIQLKIKSSCHLAYGTEYFNLLIRVEKGLKSCRTSVTMINISINTSYTCCSNESLYLRVTSLKKCHFKSSPPKSKTTHHNSRRLQNSSLHVIIDIHQTYFFALPSILRCKCFLPPWLLYRMRKRRE